MPVPAQAAQALEYLPPELRQRARDYFAYSTDFLPLAAGTADTESISIQADSDFLLVAATGIARDPADVDSRFAAPAITVQLTDTGSGRQLQNQAQDWLSFFGDSELPFFLPYPKVLDRNSILTTTLENLDGAQDYDVRISYHGFKIFNWNWNAGTGAESRPRRAAR